MKWRAAAPARRVYGTSTLEEMTIRLIRISGTVAVAVALLAIPVGTSRSVALAQASCAGTTAHRNGDFHVPVPSTSDNSGNFNCIVGLGNAGSAVSDLQQSMNFCRGEHLVVDGLYGPLTASAMRRAQHDLHVTEDGIYGPATRHAGFRFRAVTDSGHAGCAAAGF
jgi:hypothetical protein